MTEDDFWQIVERTRPDDKPLDEIEEEHDRQAEALRVELGKLQPQQVADFDRLYDRLHRAGYTWDLWGVAYIAHGGCSDDSFEYFRNWLISRGRVAYETAMRDADSLFDVVPLPKDDEEVDFEAFWYVAGDVYKAKTGKEIEREPLEDRGSAAPPMPAGERWTEDDIDRRFPRTSAQFDAVNDEDED